MLFLIANSFFTVKQVTSQCRGFTSDSEQNQSLQMQLIMSMC